MDADEGLTDLVEHLERMTRLSRGEATRVVAEVIAYFSELPQQFVTRRHSQLQGESRSNAEIFEQIARELRARRFVAPPLTERQIRRLIYG